MANPEGLLPEETGIPSGYESVHWAGTVRVDGTVLPWLHEPKELAVAECTLRSGESFYLASAVGTHPKLVGAANRMTTKQHGITDNMFYSRLPGFVMNGHAPNIEVMAEPITESPIWIMRNDGGQRVYFTAVELPTDDGTSRRVIIRLAACDKNAQMGLVVPVLSSATNGYNRRRSK